MTDTGNGGDGNGSTPAQGTPPSDDDHIRSLIREELEDFVNDLTDLGGSSDDSDDGEGGGSSDGDGPLTVRQIEQAAERATRKAMKPLQDELSKRQRAKPKAAPAPVEDPPVEPPKGLMAKVGKALWGGDE